MEQWKTQAVNITNNHKFKIDFTLPEFSATKKVACNCHVYDSAKSGYNMILGRDLLTALGLCLRFSDQLINLDDGPFQRCIAPMSCSSPRWDNLPSGHQRNPLLGLFGTVHVLGSKILF